MVKPSNPLIKIITLQSGGRNWENFHMPYIANLVGVIIKLQLFVQLEEIVSRVSNEMPCLAMMESVAFHQMRLLAMHEVHSESLHCLLSSHRTRRMGSCPKTWSWYLPRGSYGNGGPQFHRLGKGPASNAIGLIALNSSCGSMASC